MLTVQQRFKKLTEKLDKATSKLERIVTELSTTTERTNQFFNQKRLEISKVYAEINMIYASWVNVNFPIEYRLYLSEYIKKINNYKNFDYNLNLNDIENRDINKQAVSAIKNDAISVFIQSSEAGKKKLNRLTAVTQNINISDYRISQAIGETNEGITTINKTKKVMRDQMFESSLDGKYIVVIDKNGKTINYKINAYADLVSKTELRNLQSTAAISTAYEVGTDLIQVSSHNTESEICQKYEGKIFSLSGKNKDFPIADAVPAYHPNCKHTITPTFVELMKVDGTYNKFVEFSNDKTDTHPTRKNFIPIKDR